MNNNYHNKRNTATTTTTKQFELKASVDASKDNIFIIIIRVTRLGDLWGITSDKFSCESSTTNFGDFLDYFGNTTLKKDTAVDTFGQLLRNFGLLFIPTSGHTDHHDPSSNKNIFSSRLLLIFTLRLD